MKKVLSFLLCLSFLTTTITAEIHYTNYGDGWVIPVNTSEPLDINQDGIVDLYVNDFHNELGFTPIIGVGCIAGANTSSTPFGAYPIKQYELGDFVQISSDNISYYIDTDRGSAYSITTSELASGWADNVDQYIGFVVLTSNSLVSNGWMKIAIDVEQQSLIIKEIAYEDLAEFGSGGIEVGDTGATVNVPNLDNVLSNVKLSPNPAKDFVQLNFNYTGLEDLSVVVIDAVGKAVYRNIMDISAIDNLTIHTTDWSPGIYYIRFENSEGIHTEKLSVSK